MASRPPKPSKANARAAEACREARANTLRRSGWQPGEPFPAPDDQGFQPRQVSLANPSIDSTSDDS